MQRAFGRVRNVFFEGDYTFCRKLYALVVPMGVVVEKIVLFLHLKSRAENVKFNLAHFSA